MIARQESAQAQAGRSLDFSIWSACEHTFVYSGGPKRRPGETRAAVAAALQRGLSYSQIAAELDIAKSVVAYHARRIGIPADDSAARRYDWDAIQCAYDQGKSVRQCAAEFGFALATWHKAAKRGAIRPRPRTMDIEHLLVEGRLQTNRSHLKSRLYEAKLKSNVCELCGLTEWLGRPLSMELHHKNGNKHDNRLGNLQILCPNCHSQTETYGGRNGHRRPRPTLP